MKGARHAQGVFYRYLPLHGLPGLPGGLQGMARACGRAHPSARHASNPPDLTPFNFKLVRFSEHKIDGKVKWLFFPDQCRHCVNPPCKDVADSFIPGAILQDEATGAVIYTDVTQKLSIDQAQAVREACPYNIPRRNEDTGLLTKCDWCIDRSRPGSSPPASRPAAPEP